MAHSEWHAWWRRASLREDTVLWTSLDGAGMLGSPRALFDAILDEPRHAHLHHVWAVTKDLLDSDEVAAITRHPRVSCSALGSRGYFRALATAKHLVNDSPFPPHFSKRPGQVYLNTSRGMPLRHTGYDDLPGRLGAANVTRNFLQADFLTSSGPAMTATLYEQAYRLGGIYPGTVLEVGSPSVDVQFDPAARTRLRMELAGHGMVLASDPVALLAANWPGGGNGDGLPPVESLRDWLSTLRRALGPNWTVLLCLDPHATRALWDTTGLRGALVPSTAPVDLVLGATDLLVTDSPDLVFSFLPRDRPAVFLAPDEQPGEGPRGYYVAPDQWPGAVVRDDAGLAAAASRVAAGHDDFARRRQTWRERYCPLDDGAAAQRLIDIVFAGRADPAAERKLEPDGRTRLLLHLGGMLRNGITSSALNLLRTIDHERVDVTGFFLDSSHPERLASASEIDPRVRILLRSGGFTSTKARYLRVRAAYTRGADGPAELTPAMRETFADEWTRCFGSAQFDRIADFSGYGAMWGFILLAGPAPLHGIWLHNEMVADSNRVVHGKRPLRKRLHAVFSLYASMDRLVSVSPALRDVNREQLARFAEPQHFVYARNTLDFDRIDQLAAAGATEDDAGALPVMRWLSDRRDSVVFVTAGRLSSEKNHDRLVRAFAQVRRVHPSAALLIIGDGALRSHLAALVRELELGESCLLAGFQPNPFQFMRQCQCFVLSSNHEGQPMVILEALHLGLQVVTTRFSSVDSALPAGCGLVVDQDVDALAEGMLRSFEGRLGPVNFDSAAYNEAAIQEFYEALAIPSPRADRSS